MPLLAECIVGSVPNLLYILSDFIFQFFYAISSSRSSNVIVLCLAEIMVGHIYCKPLST